MDKINRFIDRCLIDEYADKKSKDGYSLDVDDLPKKEIKDLVDILLDEDTDTRDTVLFQIQKLINERLPIVESDDREWRKYYG